MLLPRKSASATVKSEKRPSRKSESAAQVPGLREEGHHSVGKARISSRVHVSSTIAADSVPIAGT